MAKLIFALSFLFMHQVFGAESYQPNIIMFIGNPGVGKSTIINSLKQEKVASAGVSIGSGLTKFFNEYRHNHEGKDFLLFDTPGLEDVKLRERAAQEIEKALKKEGIYKLFFVITLEAGRIKPADITTIDMVMEAIKREDRKFNVIVNKVSKKEKAALDDLNALQEFLKQLNSGKFKTDSVYYIDSNHALTDEDIEFFTPTPKFEKFIYKSSETINIKKREVQEIEIDKFEKIKQAHETELANIKRELEAAKNKPPTVINHYHSNSNGGGGCVVQ